MRVCALARHPVWVLLLRLLHIDATIVDMSLVVTKLGRVAERHWGLVTTAEAAAAGVNRYQMSRLASAGALTRVAHGVYRVTGAPETEHETTYAAWLALGGATAPFDVHRVPPVVAAGTTAADVLGIGDFLPEDLDFLVPQRRQTRMAGVRLRTQRLEPHQVTFMGGLPVLTVEATIADLVGQWVDESLVADTLRDALEQGRITDRPGLVRMLSPFAARRGHQPGDGGAVLAALEMAAGVTTAAPA